MKTLNVLCVCMCARVCGCMCVCVRSIMAWERGNSSHAQCTFTITLSGFATLTIAAAGFSSVADGSIAEAGLLEETKAKSESRLRHDSIH